MTEEQGKIHNIIQDLIDDCEGDDDADFEAGLRVARCAVLGVLNPHKKGERVYSMCRGDKWRTTGGSINGTFKGRRFYRKQHLTSSLQAHKWFEDPNEEDEIVTYKVVEVSRVPATTFYKERLSNGRSTKK